MAQLRASVDYTKCKKALLTSINDIDRREPITTLTVEKCPSVDDAITLLSQEWFRQTVFENLSSLIAMRMKINNSIATPLEWKPRLADFNDKPRLLIALESTMGNQCVSYWRNLDSKEFLKLNLIEESISKDVINYTIDFIADALLEENGFVTSLNSNVLSLTSLITSTNFNLLLAAVDEGESEMVELLLKQPFDVNEDFNMGDEIGMDGEKIPCYKRLIDIAWARDNDEILLALLKAGSTYPTEFDKSVAWNKILEFLDTSETLHKHIKRGKIDEIRKILVTKKDQRYFFNANNVSAVHAAVKCRNIDIYQLLIEHNLTFGPDEQFGGRLSRNFGDLLCDINTEQTLKLPKRHILLLLSKSVVPRHNTALSQALSAVKKSLTTLDSMPLIRPILVVVSVNRKTKIHFDFTQWSVVFMDPTLSPFTRGIFNSNNKHLHIAAKSLLFDHSKCAAEATMTHEFDHSALDDTFRNERLPYDKDDEENRTKWQEIIEHCKNLMEADEIVASVFRCYKEEAWGRELAVRAPHMIVHYQNDEVQLEILKEIFKSLFDYHKDVVIPAMIAAAPVLEKLANEHIDVSYEELTEPLKAALRHAEVEFQGERLKLGEITSADVMARLTSKQIRDTLEGKLLEIAVEVEIKKKIAVYITRKFTKYGEDDDNNVAINSQGLCEQVSETKVLLLADKAGAGKSTTMRHFRDELKMRNPHFWVSYVDLKRHTHIYGETSENINVFEVIKKIFAIADDTLESTVFAHLFKSNRVILLLDGVDEIAPKYKNFFLNFVANVQKLTKNQQWIATRPQHAQELSQLLHCDAYKLLPLSTRNIQDFTKSALIAEGVVDAGALQSCIISCLMFVDIDEIEENQNNNPLVLQMLVQLAAAGRLRGLTLNRCAVYEEMIELKRDIVAERGTVVNRDMSVDSRLTITDVHMVFALKLLFPDGEIPRKIALAESECNCNRFALLNLFQCWCRKKTNEGDRVSIASVKLLQRWRHERTSWSPEKISRLGLLLVDGWETLEEIPDFTHRTFAEFFAVKFVAESVKDATMEFAEGEMSEAQFNARMEILLNVSHSLLENSEFAFLFFENNLRRLRDKRLACEEIFTNLLERAEVIRFLRENAEYGMLTIIIEIARLFGHSKKLIKAISKFGEDSHTLFQTCVKNDEFQYCLPLFDAFERSQLPNWHRLTGYGLELDSSQLRLSSASELEQLARNLEIDTQFSLTMCDRSDEMVFLSYNLLCFVECVDDFPTDDVAKLLMYLVGELHCAFTMRSRMLIDKLFSIIRKHYGESKNTKVSEILASVFTEFSKVLIFYPDLNRSTIIENVGYIITEYGNYLEPDAETSEEEDVLAESAKDPMLILVAVLRDIEWVIAFCRRYLEPRDILAALSEDFPGFVSDFFMPEDIERFDKFVTETSESEVKTVFQQFLIHSKDLKSNLRLCGTLVRLFKDDWLDHVGYNQKDSVDVAPLFTDDQIEEIAATIEDDGDDFEDERSKVVNLCHFLNALWLCEIPMGEFEKLQKNLAKNITKMAEKHESLQEAINRIFINESEVDDNEEVDDDEDKDECFTDDDD